MYRGAAGLLTRKAAMGIRERATNTLPVLSNDPRILRGQTVFAGTRVPLDVLEAYRRKGHDLEDFLEDYPTVERWQAEAAWQMSDEELQQHIRRGAGPAR